MLDVSVRILPRLDVLHSCTFEVTPYSKPTHRPLPLQTHSHHNPSVHNWPLGQVNRLWRNSSSWDIFQHARVSLFSRYAEQLLSKDMIDRCFKTDPRFSNHISRNNCGGRVFTLVLRFHPRLSPCKIQTLIDAAVRLYVDDLKHVFKCNVRIRVAWANDSANLVHKLRSVSRIGKKPSP